MGTNRARDLILIGAVVAIAVAALWPAASPEGDAGTGAGGPAGASTGAPAPQPDRPTGAVPAAPAPPSGSSAFPLVEGARWIYHVEGPKALVPSNEWTMELRALPSAAGPGEIAAGFGEEREAFPVWDDGGRVRFAGLPFTAPLEFSKNVPISVEGSLFPAGGLIPEGASWEQVMVREVVHEMATEKGRPEGVPARCVETDRALAAELADVVVPAGTFPARRVDWTCRVELFRGKRPILDPLTAKAFRTEIMWIADGVGIVRRRVEHAFPSKAIVVFDLLDTTIPPPRGGPPTAGRRPAHRSER